MAGQNAAHAHRLADGQADRTAFLTAVAGQWEQLDSARHPRLHRAAAHLAQHDDREQFLIDVEVILAGLTVMYRDQRRT